MNRYGYYCRVQRITATFRSRLQSVRNGRDPVNQPCSIATSPSKRPTQLAHSTGGIVPVPVLLSRSTSDAWPFLLRGSRPREPRDFPQRVPTFALAIARGTLHGLQRDSPAATARLSVPSWPSPGIFSCRCHAANQNANLVPNSIVPVPILFGTRFASPLFHDSGTAFASLTCQHSQSVIMAGAGHRGPKTASQQGRSPTTTESPGPSPAPPKIRRLEFT